MRRAAAGICGAVILALGGNALPAQHSSRPPPELQKSVDAYNAATLRRDTAALSNIVTDDYVLVNSDGSVQDKTSYLADFRRPGFSIDPYKMEHPIFRVARDAALTAWYFQLHWTQDGRRQNRRLRISHFWMKRDGRWQIAYTQLTRVPE